MIRIAAFLAFILGLSLAGSGQAEERSSLLPTVPKATGQAHPEGNEYMRKRHMDLMRHDRDLTLREGERDVGASLKGCFACHAVEDQGQVVTYESEKHFCRVCHDYVAVKVDCFACHRSTPDGVDEGTAHAGMMMPQTGMMGHVADQDSVKHYLSGLAKAAKRPMSQPEAGQ